ncbi:MAG: hypothetical protein ACJ8LM_05875 [Candidatus Udaeobacter sp.]
MKTTILFLLLLPAGGLPMERAAAQSLVKAKADVIHDNKVMPTTYGNLDAQISETLYELTRARLERVMRINARVPGTVSIDDVGIVNGELKAMNRHEGRNGEAADWFSTLIGVAEVTKASADSDWKRVSALQQGNSQLFSDLDVELVRLRARLADLNLQRGRLAARGTADERQNWAVLYLSMEMQELKDRVRVAEERQ